MKKIFAILFLSIMAIPCLTFARDASALTDWYIKDFQSDIVVNNDSSLLITEKITADCGTLPNKHGIFRIVPTFYKIDGGKKIKTPIELKSITDFSNSPIPYKTIKESGTITWKIGDPNKTVSGENHYVITYLVKNTIRFNNSGFDEFYWNLNGNYWQIPIDHYVATIKFPAEVTKNNSTVNIYSGFLNDPDNQYANYEWTDANTLKVESTSVLETGNGITASVTFPKNIIAPYKPSFFETYGIYFWLLIPLLTFIFLYRYWVKFGKDPKINSAIAPEFEIPDKLSPLDMGMLYSNKLFAGQFLTASIINLAVNGAIKIEEIPKKGILSQKDYKLTKVMISKSKLSGSEKLLMNELFSSSDEVLISSLKLKFASSLQKITKASENYLDNEGYFSPNTAGHKVIIGIFLFAFAILAGFLASALGGWFAVSFGISAVLCFIFMFLITKRTEKGAMLEHRIKGFKLYMETAEKYRQQFNEKENIFEKFLPYAIMFGMTKKWIAAMKSIYGEKYFRSYHPVWYYGTIGTFNADSFESSISNMSKAMVASMAPSSSGSGGGGYSGGGGGGGGGGGW